MRSHFASAKAIVDGLPTPLGAAATWSSSLKNTFGILLNSWCPMFLVWDCGATQSNSSDSGERILLYNDAYLSFLKEIQPLIPPDRANDRWTEYWSKIQAEVEQVLTTGQALPPPPFLPDRHGGNGHYTWSYSAVWDETGQIRGVFATGCRVAEERVAPREQQAALSDRQPAEETLRQSEERLRIAQQAANAGVWDWDITTNQVTWSDEYYRLYGLDPAVNQPSYDNWLNSLVEEDRDRVNQAIQAALAHQIDLNVEFRILHPTQEERWLTAIGQTFYNPNGQPIRMSGIALDITRGKQAEKALERYQLLSEYSRDIILYFRDNGEILEANRAAVQTYGYDRAELLTLKISDLRAPTTLDNLSEQLEQASQQGILFETVHRRKDGSYFPVEVSAQSAVIENENVVLSVIRDITERKQAELEQEQLLVREQAAREVAEAAEQRASFLAEASTTLTSSLDYAYTLRSVAEAVVPILADWCAIDILRDDGTLERLATTHVDPVKVQWGWELHRRYPPDLNAPHGIAQVLRTGQAEYHPMISDDQVVAAARDDEHLRILREIGLSSVLLVPLNVRGRTLGTISFVAAESGRSYSLEDLSLAEELARRAAIALDNARLYQEAQQARQTAERAADRTARLQAVTAALSESLTPLQVAEVIVQQSMEVLEAAAALMVLVSTDRTELEIVKSVGYQADLVETWRRFSINTDVPLAQAIRTGEPIWVETLLERIARYPHLAEVYSRYEFASWIALPLVVEGKSIGGILLSFKEFRLLNQDDREFIVALSRQCAQAIVRAQLYAAEQQARAEAERANRIKDEFLAVLSHELRSPLNPILGWAKLLQTRQFDQASTQRALETIERNAKLQTQLIDDLLDVSRILRGKMMLNVDPVDLALVIDAAVETVRLSAEAKSIDIHKVTDNVGLIAGDSGRLQQVVWNLLSNAVKFTATGGQIEIRLQQVGLHAQIQVRDTGKGITPEFLPHVFEYFRQEDGTTTRKFGGLGLGLAIVRYLTELHGGTVEAESPGEGLGATFTVLLPLSKNKARENPDEMEMTGAATNPFPLANLRILVVDDEADMRELTFAILEQTGAETRVVASANAALATLAEFKPDMLICDIGMPKMDGYELMRQLRSFPPEQGGQIPAIALTAYAGEIDQQQAIAAGFQRHLAKPVEPEALVRAIVTLMKQGFSEIEMKPI
ncbi:MAG TPA: PAS domain S-box protein [Coleofasciculaceae cyanobacterium]